MKGFVAVLSLVLLALVCNSGALHVPAAGVAAAYNKCRYLDRQTNSKGVVFATGTPISNSMTETLSGKKRTAT